MWACCSICHHLWNLPFSNANHLFAKRMCMTLNVLFPFWVIVSIIPCFMNYSPLLTMFRMYIPTTTSPIILSKVLNQDFEYRLIPIHILNIVLDFEVSINDIANIIDIFLKFLIIQYICWFLMPLKQLVNTYIPILRI